MNNSPNYEGCDETKFSYTNIPNKITYKRERKFFKARGKDCNEILFSLICKGILNVCQLIEDENGDVYSIPINPENVEERLSMEEILADISLMELLSGDTGDRSIIPFNDERNKAGETISGNNLRIYPNGVYSTFDFNDITLGDIKHNEILNKLWSSIKSLYGDYKDIIVFSSYFINLGLLREKYGNRMLKKVEELLERYDSKDGKILFLAQIRQSIKPIKFAPQRVNDILGNAKDFWYNKDKEKYENFIKTLKRLKAIFSKNNKALEKYIMSRKVFEEEIREQVRKIAEGVDEALLRKIIKEELG